MITVALPNHASEISWFSMESLCRQVQAPEWELIVFEDNTTYLGGQQFYMDYFPRLQKVGCKRIKYIYQEERISLAEKWCAMAEIADKDSIGMILQASDCYSDPLRIYKTYLAFKAGYNWYQSNQGYFFHFRLRRFMMYKSSEGTGLNMAISMKEMRKVKPIERWSGVDWWLFNQIKKPKVFIDDDWKKSLDTDGYNRISLKRRTQYQNPKPPFYKCFVKLSDILPPDVIKMI